MTTDDFSDDEPTESELAQEARIEEPLSASSESVKRVIDDCHEAFGFGIPTLVLAQVGKWYWQNAASPDPDPAAAASRAAEVLSDLYEEGDDFVQTIIATGFLEALPFAHEQGREVVERLPTPLREELKQIEDWTPG